MNENVNCGIEACPICNPPKRSEREPAPGGVVQEARRVASSPGREEFTISHWGYVEAFEAVLFRPVPHMKVTDHMRIGITSNVGGAPFGNWRLFSKHRSVV